MSKKLNYGEMPKLNGTAMPEHVYESLKIARELAGDFDYFLYRVRTGKDIEFNTEGEREFWKHTLHYGIWRQLKSDIETVKNLMQSSSIYITNCGETNPCSCHGCTKEGPFKRRGIHDVIANHGWGSKVFDFIIEHLIIMCDYFYKEFDWSLHYVIDKQMSPIIWALIPCTAGNL